jgi:hypothetical protein
MNERELSGFNRQLFVDLADVRATGHDPAAFLALIYGSDGYTTPVTARIPTARRRVQR